jgi:3-oxoadipate enol-lactonase
MLIETRCGRLFVEEHDPELPGTPVVFWHSLLCDGGMWKAQIDALSGRVRAINIDAPGHGRSAPSKAPYTMDDCVAAALEVLDALKIERCKWVGLSWGGMVGMRLALAAPHRIERLALLDTNADAESKEKLPRYRVLALVARTVGAIPVLLDRLVPIFFSKATIRHRPELIQTFRERLGAMDKGSIHYAVDAVIFRRSDVRSRLKGIRCPTLVVVGRDDVATPAGRADDIASRVPSAKQVSIADAGHLSAWEQPGAVNAALLPFLDLPTP